MYRRYNLAHFILASVVALGLTMLVCVEPQARIALLIVEIYVMGHRRRRHDIALVSDRTWKHGNLRDGQRWGQSAKTHQ